MDNLEVAQIGAIKRLVTDGFLKKTCQLKIQVSLYCLHRAISGLSGDHDLSVRYGEVQWFALLPILVTLFTGLATMVDLVISCVSRQKMLRDNIAEDDDWWSQMDEDRQRKYLRSVYFTVAICLIFAFCAYGIFYSLMQVILVHRCETSLWNWSGCVMQSQLDAMFREANSTGKICKNAIVH